MTAATVGLLARLCSRAITADIGLDELTREQPDGLDHRLLQSIWEDLADAVEHTPGRWPGGGVDRKAWERSPQYVQLLIDRALLLRVQESGDFDRLADCHEQLTAVTDASDVDGAVSACIDA